MIYDVYFFPRFCTVYNDTSTQQKIFSECVEPLLSNAFDGQNVSVFAYGPTGAGRDYFIFQ